MAAARTAEQVADAMMSVETWEGVPSRSTFQNLFEFILLTARSNNSRDSQCGYTPERAGFTHPRATRQMLCNVSRLDLKAALEPLQGGTSVFNTSQ